MAVVGRCELPESALLRAYESHAYADCFTADIGIAVSLEEFVAAFYTTRLFKLERSILKWAVSKPSTDEQARQLAAGTISEFAAWHVEDRAPNQLLLSDMNSRTRSWLMIDPAPSKGGPATRLYFGSAVVPGRNRKSGKAEMGFVFRALLGFHKLYSEALLRAAVSRLRAMAEKKN
ncbi:MAG: hypothetical protein LH481_08485 [Burkholderiales bacterium]|nr:hypothetical protein [Burkholderiales bacterium]